MLAHNWIFVNIISLALVNFFPSFFSLIWDTDNLISGVWAKQFALRRYYLAQRLRFEPESFLNLISKMSETLQSVNWFCVLVEKHRTVGTIFWNVLFFFSCFLNLYFLLGSNHPTETPSIQVTPQRHCLLWQHIFAHKELITPTLENDEKSIMKNPKPDLKTSYVGDLISNPLKKT